jgi:putative membrane protein
MMIGFALLVLLLLGGIVLAIGGAGWLRHTGDVRPSNRQRRSTARQLLDQRLARGEIDQDEYEAIRARLDS